MNEIETATQLLSLSDKLSLAGILVVIIFFMYRQLQDKEKLEEAMNKIAQSLERITMIYEKQLTLQNELLSKHIEEIDDNTRETLHTLKAWVETMRHSKYGAIKKEE